jgi:heptosyltransferase II
MQKFLIIQTAFTGDVVLATAISEKLRQFYPDAVIDFLVRKGNEGVLKNSPTVNTIHIWDKQRAKNRHLIEIILEVRKQRYDTVINLQRFAATGLITFLSGAKNKIGYDKNPFSFCFTKQYQHQISEPYAQNPVHETERNQLLITDITDAHAAFPKMYPSAADYASIQQYQLMPYVCIAPASVWFTKQYPVEKWVKLVTCFPKTLNIILLGGKGDANIADAIINGASERTIVNCCGKLNYLQSAALMEGARMNYVNDSAPLHFASAMNAPVTAVFCSTVRGFGFGPLRENARLVETPVLLSCRPCGLHGQKRCPEGHFKCAMNITEQQLLWWM